MKLGRVPIASQHLGEGKYIVIHGYIIHRYTGCVRIQATENRCPRRGANWSGYIKARQQRTRVGYRIDAGSIHLYPLAPNEPLFLGEQLPIAPLASGSCARPCR